MPDQLVLQIRLVLSSKVAKRDLQMMNIGDTILVLSFWLSGLDPFRGQFHKLIYAQRQTICALRPTLRPTFEKLLTGAKVQRKAQKIGIGRKTV